MKSVLGEQNDLARLPLFRTVRTTKQLCPLQKHTDVDNSIKSYRPVNSNMCACVKLPNTCRYSAKLVNKYRAILCYVKRKNNLSVFSTDSGISEHKNVLFRELECFRICDVELSNTRYAISTKYFELILIICHDSFNLRAVGFFPLFAGS